MSFHIQQDFANLELNERAKTIWGSVWVELNGKPFPEAGWNDMPAAFIVELLSVANDFRKGATNTRQVRFFDGPYELTIGETQEKSIEIRAKNHDEQGATTVAGSNFAAIVRSAATSLLEACQARSWSENSDVRRLAANL
ncbi:hypothetical protein ABT256_16755 [Amycolatopsis japonica]|uniref:hypothetical protein n=1 Tax=Amycolatopsis japonica TaxID=208439 RepID=UPI003333BD5F